MCTVKLQKCIKYAKRVKTVKYAKYVKYNIGVILIRMI